MLQVQREVLRPRLRPSLVATLLVSGALIAGVAGRLAFAPSPEPKRVSVCTVQLHDSRKQMEQLREEIRMISLEACTARVELDRMALRAACDAGTVSRKECAPDDGQYRIDRCSRYRPPESFDRCPFPGSCTR